MKGAARVEMILLLFGDVVFLGFGWMLWFSGSCAQTSHTPTPLKRGDLDVCFFLVMRGLWRGGCPSREGIKGCVMVRGAAGDEEFRESVYRGVWCCEAVSIRH